MAWQGLDRRRFPRGEFPCLVKVAEKGKGTDAALAHTENISSGGICVILRKGLDLFSSVAIELDLMDGDDHIFCTGKVVWVVRRKATETEKPSFYDMGIEFVDMDAPVRQRIERTVEHLVKSGHKI